MRLVSKHIVTVDKPYLGKLTQEILKLPTLQDEPVHFNRSQMGLGHTCSMCREYLCADNTNALHCRGKAECAVSVV